MTTSEMEARLDSMANLTFDAMGKHMVDSGFDMVEAVAIRPCDGCQHCCILPAIPFSDFAQAGLGVYHKPFSIKCRYCDSTGCSIHSKRPEVCRGYLCTYRTGLHDERPDQCGVSWALEVSPSGKALSLIGQCLDAESVFNSEAQLDSLEAILSSRMGEQTFEHAIVRTADEVFRIRLTASGDLTVDQCELIDGEPDLSTMKTWSMTAEPA